MAVLLCEPSHQATVAETLKKYVASRHLEYDAALGILPFWLARLSGNVCEPAGDVGSCIRARSALSDQLVASIGSDETGSYAWVPTLAPANFSATASFLASRGSHVPRILWTVLTEVESKFNVPVLRQFAYEWERTKEILSESAHGVTHFFDEPRDSMTCALMTEQSRRGRSAFLRTLEVARSVFGMPASYAEYFAQQVAPLHPALSLLRSAPPFDTGQVGGFFTESSSIENALKQVISLTAESRTLGAISWPMLSKTGELLDLTVVLCHQKPDGSSLENDGQLVDEYVGDLMSEKLSPVATCRFNAASFDLDSGRHRGGALAGKLFPDPYGHLQSDIHNRGIWGPIPAHRLTEPIARPFGGRLTFSDGRETFASFGYWNADWRPTHHKELGPRCGTFLECTTKFLKQALGDDKRVWYQWSCKRWTKPEWGAGSVTVEFGAFPHELRD